MKTQKPLTVYKASAGSGKTFTLATEYMKLVIANPQAYRSILAVTFTNKATEEMKQRIMSQLYGISKQLPDSDSYSKKIQESLGYSQEQVAQRAGEALKNLLHHYHYFMVETIDSFFQRVMRNLAKELDHTANLRIELNDAQIEEQAVDALIENLNDGDELLQWIIAYVGQNIDEDKNWNVIGKIKSFGKNIFKDFYKKNEEALNNKLEKTNFFEDYTKQIKDLKESAEHKIKLYGESFYDALEENDLTADDFKFKEKGICGYFKKLCSGKWLSDPKFADKKWEDESKDPGAWFAKANRDPRNPAYSVVENTLIEILNDTMGALPDLMKQYKSADITLRHLSQLRLLSSIEGKVREMNKDTNRFLLSDTQSLLQSLIKSGGNDAPFIFEKIGSQLEHIMIDEFQDTSTTQWQNFKVLLEETMSHEQSNNLIVGDVKQSIYRWRSGDWKILNDIEKEFSNPQDRLQVESLACNYRSDRNIIDFNNHFFQIAVKHECDGLKEKADKLRQAYADVVQQVPDKKEKQGYVKVGLLPKDNDYKNKMLQETVDTVDGLISQGFSEKQIAILVRGNETIRDIADYFLTHCPQYQLVSNEAFRLDASSAVNTIILAMQLLIVKDDIKRATLVKYYQKCTNDKEELPQEYVGHEKELLELPLFELVERLSEIFHVHDMQEQSAYVCAFYDQLNKFLQDGTANIEDFLQEWEERIHLKAIQSDEIDGIRLMTIHKSKGLEFDNVIMPFCDWQLEKSNVIWCSPDVKPYNQLPIIPVDFSKTSLMGTIYEDDYKQEHLQNVVDNLNLLYVAFTRARQNLYVFGKRKVSNTRSFLIENSLNEVAEQLQDAVYPHPDDETQPITFEYGTCVTHQQKENNSESENVFLKPVDRLSIKTRNYPVKAEFRQSNKSRELIEGEDEKATRNDYVKLGTIFHQIFSTIHTLDDIDGALKQLELDGVLNNETIKENKLKELLRQRLNSPMVKDWFSNKWELSNECSILSVNKKTNTVETHRPDRVMTDGDHIIVVDFKFATPRKEHHKQVQGYIDLLRQMGHEDVKGYLWYVYPNKIEEV